MKPSSPGSLRRGYRLSSFYRFFATVSVESILTTAHAQSLSLGLGFVGMKWSSEKCPLGSLYAQKPKAGEVLDLLMDKITAHLSQSLGVSRSLFSKKLHRREQSQIFIFLTVEQQNVVESYKMCTF